MPAALSGTLRGYKVTFWRKLYPLYGGGSRWIYRERVVLGALRAMRASFRAVDVASLGFAVLACGCSGELVAFYPSPPSEAGTGEEATDATVDASSSDDGQNARNDADVSQPKKANDAGGCPDGVDDLSYIGTRDFHVSLSLETSQGGWVALVNQRKECNSNSVLWDVRVCSPGQDDCIVSGGLFVETSDNTNYASLRSTSPVADGNTHDITVARVAGVLSITIDGVASGSTPSNSSFSKLPSLQVGTDVCVGSGNDPTVDLTGILRNLCITTP